MITLELIAVILYAAILFLIGFLSYQKHKTADDFLIGGRGLNFYLTALAAHASDMSSWLFIAFPAVMFMNGVFNYWIGIGLCLFMFLNWQFIAPKIRYETEKYNCLTFSSYFESRFHDTTGGIRILTALMSLVFYTIYVSAGLYGIAIVIGSLFGISYQIGIIIGVIIIVPYLLIGGYTTLAWLDLFQGLFLLCVIIIVPLVALGHVGGLSEVLLGMKSKGITLSLIPNFTITTFLQILSVLLGWGLGYFGQPHITTKFMGIKKISEMKKAKYFGMSWQILTLTFAGLIGLISISYFQGSPINDQKLFVTMTRDLFPPFIAAFMLCAVLAATISTMDSQILVLASSLTEDFYKRVIKKNASSKELLLVSRINIGIVTLLAFIIAFFKIGTIYKQVLFAWSGLGSSFGPILIFALYSKRVNRYGALAGILVGGTVAVIWPMIDNYYNLDIFTIIPGFICSMIAIYLTSLFTHNKSMPLKEQNDKTTFLSSSQ